MSYTDGYKTEAGVRGSDNAIKMTKFSDFCFFYIAEVYNISHALEIVKQLKIYKAFTLISDSLSVTNSIRNITNPTQYSE